MVILIPIVESEQRFFPFVALVKYFTVTKNIPIHP